MCKGRFARKKFAKGNNVFADDVFLFFVAFGTGNRPLRPVKQLRFNFLTQQNKEKGNGLLPFP